MSGRVIIAGAGIGGLTAAIALRQRGCDVSLYERAQALEPVGAGILLAVNALLVLKKLKVHEAVVAAGARVRSAEIQTWQGRTLSTIELDALEREFGAPVVAFHRADLHQVLLALAGAERVHLGKAAKAVHQDAARVVLELEDGSREEADVLVGADGLRSVVRRCLRGDEPLRYAGQTSWRGVCDAGALVPQGSTVESWGPGQRFGYVRLSGERVYWFAVADAAAGQTEGPNETRDNLVEMFRGWHAPIQALLEATRPEAILRTDLYDRVPVRRWSFGRATLLGDAAHPMTPNLGQGACQAVEDAWVLAEELGCSGPSVEALTRYEKRRLARTSAVVRQSYRFGALAHWKRPWARWLRDSAVRTFSGVAVQQVRRFALEVEKGGTV